MTKKSANKKAESKIKKGNVRRQDSDIIQMIIKDHKPLKLLIETMKGEKPSYSHKKAAFEKFAPALVAHAKPEEQTWYKEMKSKKTTRIAGLEGEVEHGLADQLCEELKRTDDKDLFMAKVKVLAELVKHHIEEEEKDMLPDFKKKSTNEERMAFGENYMKIREEFISHSSQNPPREKNVSFDQMEVNSK